MVRIHRQNTHRAFLFLPHQFPTPERHSTPHRHTHAMEPQSNIDNFFLGHRGTICPLYLFLYWIDYTDIKHYIHEKSYNTYA